MKSIGIVKHINLDAYRAFAVQAYDHPDSIRKEREIVSRMVNDAVDHKELVLKSETGYYQSVASLIQGYVNRFFQFDRYYSNYEGIDTYRNVDYLKKMIAYSETYGQPIEYIYDDDVLVCIELPKYSFAIPREMVTIQPYQDYSHIPVAQIGVNQALSAMMPSVQGELTQYSVKEQIQSKQDAITRQMEEIQKKEEEQKAEIERIKQEIEAKYANQIALLNQKKQELSEQKEKLEAKLFVLDTQIYGIRCYFGETVSFTKLVSGKEADVEEPVVLHQKIRFLDEELAKYVAMYDVDGSSTGMFETLIQSREDMREFFFPGRKSISLIRISKDGKTYDSGFVEMADGRTVYCMNVMKEYEVFHGNKLGILIRNGENCYIGWTDQDRISLSDDNVFLTPKTTVEEAADGRMEEKSTGKKEIASRYFLFSIMQGLVLHSRLLNLPEGVDLVHADNRYVVYSMADAWLKDNRYGTFADILNTYQGLLRKGDMILTVRKVAAEGNKYVAYNNDRGIGYRNRTHDVYAKSNHLYPVNLVENSPARKFSFERRWNTGGWSNWHREVRYTNEQMPWEEFTKRYSSSEFRDVKVEDTFEQKIYISLKKDPNWRTDVSSTANFELMSDEYINLTFLNSSLIKYVLMNRELGSFGSDSNFASVLPFLNHALDYLLKREEEEAELLSRYMELPEDWQMKLSHWKMKKDVHVVTDYQAKRFANSLKS